MYDSNSRSRDICKIDTKQLRKPKLKGFKSWMFIDYISGAIDSKSGLIQIETSQVVSPWIKRKQGYFNSYMSEMYNVTGQVLKDAYIERDKLNLELNKLVREIEAVKAENTDISEISETIEEKRKVLNGKKKLKELEEKTLEKLIELKRIKFAIEETEHELEQILYKKKNVAESKIFRYLRGAGKIVTDTNLILKNDNISRNLYESLSQSQDFEYSLDVDLLNKHFGCLKEEDAYEYTEQVVK